MICEFFLNVVFGIASGFFSMLPDFSWDVDSSVFTYFLSILQVAGYMFPWRVVTKIIGIIFSISIFRIAVAAIKSLWDLLPFA